MTLITGESFISERAKTNSKLFKDKELTAYWIGYNDGQDSVDNEDDDWPITLRVNCEHIGFVLVAVVQALIKSVKNVVVVMV